MDTKKYNWILYTIALTIIATIVVQCYWNYQNFLENKQRLSNEVQISLDNAVETYYTEQSKKNFLSIVAGDSLHQTNMFQNFLKGKVDKSKNFKITSLKITTDDPEEYKKLPKLIDSLIIKDSLLGKSIIQSNEKSSKETPLEIIPGKIKIDSIRLMKGVQSVFIALTNDDIEFSALDSLFQHELDKKKIETEFYFNYYQNDSIFKSSKTDSIFQLKNSVAAKSTYLRSHQKLDVFYEDLTKNALQRSMGGIGISLVLSLVIISTLYYLLRVINNQKELAEIKNDLISNITHEFKTPIATVSTAIEAMESFDIIEDKEKTKKYLSISSSQLKKLHLMVEKLLETATLDSEELILKKEPVDLVSLLEKTCHKFELLDHQKKLNFSSNSDSIITRIDVFHLENAVSNLIDNAIKYGGDSIEVQVTKLLDRIQINVADNGQGIEKSQQEKLFDKFYRVPKGNTHDVKGFGIGLYYSKKIAEKHGGSLSLVSNHQPTVFTFHLPYES